MYKVYLEVSIFFLLFNVGLTTIVYAQIGYQQKGLASYYHDKFIDRRTSSGERFNQNKFTAAHRKLLFNTMVRVTNLENDLSVVVRINDRGPYKYKGRVIDLTLAAAKAIKMDKKGIVPVKIEVIGQRGVVTNQAVLVKAKDRYEVGKCYNFRGEQRNPSGYGVQVSAFSELPNAKYFARELFKEGFREIVIKVNSPLMDTAQYKVIVGEFKSKESAERFIQKLKNKDFEGFIVAY